MLLCGDCTTGVAHDGPLHHLAPFLVQTQDILCVHFSLHYGSSVQTTLEILLPLANPPCREFCPYQDSALGPSLWRKNTAQCTHCTLR